MVQNDLNNVVRAVTNYAIWGSCTYDQIMENVTKMIRGNGLNNDAGVATTSTLENASPS